MLRDLTRTMFYKASFDIEADPNQDALWELVREIRRWLKHKAERDGFSLPWDTPEWTRIKNGETVKSSCGKVSLSSCLHVENSIYTWACALSEEKASNDGLAPRQWVTEVGFCGESFEKGEVSIVLSYGDRPGFIGELQEEPTPSIPGLVWRLIHSDKLRCSASGVPITDDAEQIENVDSVFNMIANPERETPVILLTPTSSGHLLIPPDKLATTLGPNAIVVYTCNSSTLCKLNALLEPYELECYGGALRVYVSIPDIEKPGEYARHRYISRRDIEKRAARPFLPCCAGHWRKMFISGSECCGSRTSKS